MSDSGNGPPPYQPGQVVNALLEIATDAKTTVDRRAIQNLVYLGHAWHMVLFGEENPLLNEETQAGPYGPIWISIQDRLKAYGAMPIDRPLDDDDGVPFESVGNPKAFMVLHSVWRKYGVLSSVELARKTTRSGTPWDRVRKGTSHASLSRIPDSQTYTFYRDQTKLQAKPEKKVA